MSDAKTKAYAADLARRIAASIRRVIEQEIREDRRANPGDGQACYRNGMAWAMDRAIDAAYEAAGIEREDES